MQAFNTTQYPNVLLTQLSQLFPAAGPQEIQYMAKALYSQHQPTQASPALPTGFNSFTEHLQCNQAKIGNGTSSSFACSSTLSYERNGYLSNVSTSPSMVMEKKEAFEDENLSDFTQLFECGLTPINQKFEDDESEESEKFLTRSKKISKEKLVKQSQNSQELQFRSRKGLWTEEEDAQLRDLVAQHGQKWSLIGTLMGGKKGKQVRDRYMNTSRPDINHMQWTEEEDELFDTLFQKYGNKWCKIAAEMPGRTENQVKNKFYCLKRSTKGKKKSLTKTQKTEMIDEVSVSTISRSHSSVDGHIQIKEKQLYKDIDCFFDFTGEGSSPSENYNNEQDSIWTMM